MDNCSDLLILLAIVFLLLTVIIADRNICNGTLEPFAGINDPTASCTQSHCANSKTCIYVTGKNTW